MNMSKKNHIQVGIKVRPLLNPKEKDVFWRVVDNSIKLVDTQCEYYFDHIFDQDAKNHVIFDKMAKQIVQSAVEGFNGTIFAYGQTSSGKTYTMMGDNENPGVMVLTVKEIFKQISNHDQRKFLLRVGYIEIYNEKINDLLNKSNQDLKIHETNMGVISVNCEELIVTSEESMLTYLEQGGKERTVGETNMNERSSRSHAIFRIIIESRKIEPGAEDCITQSILNLVDLAGSERADQTKATGARLKEGGHINKSLLFLSNVIKQLSENEDDKYISYRDSKLTRILQASLGGNALTAIICTIKPNTIEETQSTLSFAMRAKIIKNKPHVNEIVSDATMMKRLEKEIENLKTKLAEEKQKHESKSKVGELEQRIKNELLKIITCNSLETLRKQNEKRRRTWASSDTTCDGNISLPSAIPRLSQMPSSCKNTKSLSQCQLLKPATAAQSNTPVITQRVHYRNSGIGAIEQSGAPLASHIQEAKNELDNPLNKEVNFTPTYENLCEISPSREMNTQTKATTPKAYLDPRIALEIAERNLNELQIFTNLERDNDVMHDVNSALQLKVDCLTQRNKELENEHLDYVQMKFIYDEIIEYNTNLKQNQREAENRCSEQQTKIDELVIINDTIKEKMKDYESELIELKKVCEKLEIENRNFVNLDFQYESLQNKTKIRETELLDRIADKDLEISKLEKTLNSLRKRNDEQIEKISSYHPLTVCNQQLQEILQNGSESLKLEEEVEKEELQQANLKEILNEKCAQTAQHLNELTSVEFRDQELQIKLDELQKECDDLSNQLVDSLQENEILKKENLTLKELVNDFQVGSNHQEQQQISQLKEQLDQEKHANKILLENSERNIADMREQINRLTAELLEKSLVVENCLCDNNQKEKLNKALPKYGNNCADNDNAVNVSNGSYHHLSESFILKEHEMQGTIENQNNMIETLTHRLLDIEAQLESCQNQLQNMERMHGDVCSELQYEKELNRKINDTLKDSKEDWSRNKESYEIKITELKNSLELEKRLNLTCNENIKKGKEDWHASKEYYTNKIEEMTKNLGYEKQQNAIINENLEKSKEELEKCKTNYESVLVELRQSLEYEKQLKLQINADSKIMQDDWTKKEQCYESSINELKLKLESVQLFKEQNGHTDEKLQQFRENYTNLQETNRNLQNELAKHQDELARLFNDIKEFKDRESILKSENKLLQQNIEILQEQTKQLEEEKEKLQIDLEKLEKEYSVKEAKLVNNIKELEECENILKMENKQLELLIQRLEEEKKQLQFDKEESEKNYQVEGEKFCKDIKELKECENILRKANKQYQSDIELCQNQIQQIVKEKEKLQIDLKELEKSENLFKIENKQLQHDIQILQKKVEQLEEEKNKLEIDFEELANKYKGESIKFANNAKELKESENILKAENNQLKHEIQILQQQIQLLKEEKQKLQTNSEELEKEYKIEGTKLVNNIKQLEERENILKTENKQLQMQIQQLEELTKKLEINSEKLEKEYRVEGTKLVNNIKELQENENIIKTENKELQLRIHQLEEEMKKLHIRSEQLAKDYIIEGPRLLNNMKELENRENILKMENKQLQMQMQQLREQMKKLEVDFEELETKNKDECKKLMNTIKDLEQSENILKAENKQLKHDIHILEDQKQQVEKEKKKLEIDVEELEKKCKTSIPQIGSTNNLQDKLKVLTTENHCIKEEKSKLLDKLEEVDVKFFYPTRNSQNLESHTKKGCDEYNGEQSQLKSKFKDSTDQERRLRRLSKHDERRRQSFCLTNDKQTMTVPSDSKCQCEDLDEKLKECKQQLLIRDSQITWLNMQLKNHPLIEENATLLKRLHAQQCEVTRNRQLLNDETIKAQKASAALTKLKELLNKKQQEEQQQQILAQEQPSNSYDQMVPKVLANAEAQTHSDLHEEFYRLQLKNKDLQTLCRFRYKTITTLEQYIHQIESQKENKSVDNHKNLLQPIEAAQYSVLKDSYETLVDELNVIKRKYERAKVALQNRCDEVRELPAQTDTAKENTAAEWNKKLTSPLEAAQFSLLKNDYDAMCNEMKIIKEKYEKAKIALQARRDEIYQLRAQMSMLTTTPTTAS